MVGSPLREVLDTTEKGFDSSSVHARLELAPSGYFLASLHREENVDNPEVLEPAPRLPGRARQGPWPARAREHPPEDAERLEALGGKAEREGLRFHTRLGSSTT